MTNEYRIKAAGKAFIVIDPWGERLVDTFPTREAAEKDIARCKREDALYETAKPLIEISEEVLMQRFGIDRETAQYWVAARQVGENREGFSPLTGSFQVRSVHVHN
jgi:hypothetical protein